MITHHDAAVIAANAYRGPYSGEVGFDVDYDLLPRGDELVIAMPGTKVGNPLDVIRDLSAFPAWFAGLGLLHGGFGSGGVALYQRIRAVLPRDKRLVVVGHSLAGAEAQVLGACLVRDGWAQPRVVTFGAPRVAFIADYRFGHLLRSARECALYQRAGDPVPHVPTAPLFKHVARGLPLGVDCGDPIGNHAIARYVADLAAAGL